jgi:predicted lipoprotein with Yx(FWY)xxD motif
MKSFRILAGTACLGVSALLAAGCSSSSPAPAAASAATSAAAGAGGAAASSSTTVTLSTTSTSLGTVLTAPNGDTLYRFDPDTATTSACTGGCATEWPPVIGMPTAGSGVTSADLGTITRSDGTIQATYQGHPLYTYAGDSGPGQTSGNGLGGTWHVMLSAGSSGTTTSTTTKSSGGGGY